MSNGIFDIRVIHTNDLHGSVHEEVFAAVKQLEATSPKKNILKIDAGDFFSGTLLSWVSLADETLSPELEFFSRLGYHAVSIGNHEFDAGEEGLHKLLQKNVALHVPLVSSTISFKKNSLIYNERTQIAPYHIYEVNQDDKTLRIGIVSALGHNAALGCKNQRIGIHFAGEDSPEYLKIKLQERLDELRTQKQVDLVILAFHGGHPEDEELAKQVKGVDLIVAGHTHDLYERPNKVGKTFIVQAGSNGKFVGVADFTYDLNKKQITCFNNSSLKTVGLKITALQNATALTYKKQVIDEAAKRYLDPYISQTFGNPHLMAKSTLFEAKVSLKKELKMKNPLGQWVADILEEQVNRHIQERNDEYDKTPIAFYFSALKLLLRGDDIIAGQSYSFEDAFALIGGAGFDDELKPGYRTVTFYLTPAEIYKLITLFEIGSKKIPEATPVFSKGVSFDLSYKNNTKPSILYGDIPFLNRVRNVTVQGISCPSIAGAFIDALTFRKPPLLRVMTSDFMAENFFRNLEARMLAPSIIPKDKHGNKIATEQFRERAKLESLPKEFELFASYLLGMRDDKVLNP